MRPAMMRRHVGALLLGVTLLLSACGASAPAVARSAPESFSPLVKKVLPAVVNIAVTETVDSGAAPPVPPELRGTPFEKQFRDRFRNRREQIMGAGSGFVLDPAGVIVTNNHVVGHANSITVSFADGTQLPAKVIGADDLTDIAVIKVTPPKPLPAVAWGDSRSVEVGDWILACGNPFGLGGSVTAGIVSARGRDIGAGPFDDFLQLDAPINPGNSGGPTFNMDGQVVGLNTAIISPGGGSVGIGFAVPSEIAEPIVAQLIAKGRIDRGWLGVSVRGVPNGSGVMIAAVERNGPALKAGLRTGDVVDAVNGQKVDTARSLIRAVAAQPPGTTVQLSIHRNGRAMDISVSVGRRPPEPEG